MNHIIRTRLPGEPWQDHPLEDEIQADAFACESVADGYEVERWDRLEGAERD